MPPVLDYEPPHGRPWPAWLSAAPWSVGIAVMAPLSVRYVSRAAWAVAACALVWHLGRRTAASKRALEYAVCAWILLLVVPVDVAVRRGPRTGVTVARVADGGLIDLLMRKHPGRTYIEVWNRGLPIPTSRVILITIRSPTWAPPPPPWAPPPPAGPTTSTGAGAATVP